MSHNIVWDDRTLPCIAIEQIANNHWVAIWGAIIPSVPDLISQEQFRSGIGYEAALQKLLLEQQKWVTQLHGEEKFTLSWRLITTGNSEDELIFGLLGKTEGVSQAQVAVDSRNFCNRVRDTFPNDYPLEFCDRPEQVNLLRLPFLVRSRGQIAEFRRSLTPLETIRLDAHSPNQGIKILPWTPAKSHFQDIFRALVNHTTKCAISINLKPTKLTSIETKLGAQIANSYSKVASISSNESQQITGLNFGQQKQEKQLEAEQASQAWSEFIQNHRNCWEMTINILSESAIPQSIVAGLQSAISGQSAENRKETAKGQIIFPSTEAQKMGFYQNLVDLKLYRWGNSEPLSADLERLPWLFSDQEVHCLWRLPIADNSGVWGLPSVAGARDARKPPTKTPLNVEITIGSLKLNTKQLTQHLLICGVPGSGKTNTCLYLLENLWKKYRIPFMVLEPAKTEYRGLKTVTSLNQDLIIFSLGDERVAPFRFNPFQLPPQINLDSHLGALVDLFAVSMSMWGPLPNVVEQLIQEAYRRKGFTLLGNNEQLQPPCFSDLVNLVPEIVSKLGYKQETTDEITAAITLRLNKFCRGALGQMLDTDQSVDFEKLMKVPVILEMSQITNTDDRAFVMGLILNRCYQYWTARREEATGELKHLLLVEEAHNLLGNIPESSNQEQANPKGKAVKNFANMLAEVRGFGQGIAIAEQNPQGLVPEVMVNTNIKISHRIVEAKNRNNLGNSMLLTPQQEKNLASLKVGQYYYYIGGSPQPSLTNSPNFKDDKINKFNPYLKDQEIHILTQKFRQDNALIYQKLEGCPQETELVSSIEYGKHLVEILLNNNQATDFKHDMFLTLVAIPFNKNLIQKITIILSKILVERGISHLTKQQIQAIFNSAISFLALEAVKEKGKIHGWLGKEIKEAHKLLMNNILQPSADAQIHWVTMNSIPSHLLELNLPHPEYGKYPFPGTFRYESHILGQGAESFFNYLSQVSVSPNQALYDWLNKSISFLFSNLSSELKQSFQVSFALKITENRPDLLVHFLPNTK